MEVNVDDSKLSNEDDTGDDSEEDHDDASEDVAKREKELSIWDEI